VSSWGQTRDETPQNQRDGLDRLGVSRPCSVIYRIDPDHPISGNTPIEQREDIQRLIALAQAGGFDELRVYEQRIGNMNRASALS
jgi:hypothetical protein